MNSDVNGDYIQLDNGNIFIYDVLEHNLNVFDVNDNSFKNIKLKYKPTYVNNICGSYYCNYAIKLNNGNVLLQNPQIKNFIHSDEFKLKQNEYANNKIFQDYKDNASVVNEQKLLEYIKKNDMNLYEQYLSYLNFEAEARNIYIFNPETEDVKIVNSLPINNNECLQKFLLRDGNVLFVNHNYAYIYNPNNNTFLLHRDSVKLKGYDYYILMSNDDILMFKEEQGFVPYIYKNTSREVIKQNTVVDVNVRFYSILLPDDRILYLTRAKEKDGRDKNPSYAVFNCYDPHKDSLERNIYFGLDNNSDLEQILQVLKNGNVLIIPRKTYTNWNFKQHYNAEIFNPNDKKSKILKKKVHYKYSKNYELFEYKPSVLLDDGRVLIRYTPRLYELFVPKDYKKKK